MPEQWMVRVQGKEYGPVDLEELREWKREGRLIRENEIREPETGRWIPAGELPELFADEPAPPAIPPALVRQTGLGGLLAQTWQIYRVRFAQFLGLSALVIVPSVCLQLSSAAVAGGGELDLRNALVGLFNLGMVAASFVAWPIYVAGIQILTNEAALGRRLGLAEVVPRALKYWSRVALLCVLVYGAFFLLLVLAFAILVMVAAGEPGLLMIFVALALLFVQVWMFSRVFVNVLFWQQAAVLEDAGVVDSLRRSKELAQSRRDRPWWRRPLWQGVIVSSLWCLLVAGLSIGPEWSTLTAYYHTLTTAQDAQAMVQSMSAAAKPATVTVWTLALSVLQTVLRPLLGIAFVLIYLELRPAPNEAR
jgi:hypothetical protein